MGVPALLAAVCLSGAAAAQSMPEMEMICPGDARCPASQEANGMAAAVRPTAVVGVDVMAPGAPADQSLGFAPTATRQGVADGALEQRTFRNDDTGAQRTVTSNTPVPNPGRGRR